MPVNVSTNPVLCVYITDLFTFTSNYPEIVEIFLKLILILDITVKSFFNLLSLFYYIFFCLLE